MNQMLTLPCIFGQIQLNEMSLNYFQLFLLPFNVTARKFKMTYVVFTFLVHALHLLDNAIIQVRYIHS